jgi:hypothetical protein
VAVEHLPVRLAGRFHQCGTHLAEAGGGRHLAHGDHLVGAALTIGIGLVCGCLRCGPDVLDVAPNQAIEDVRWDEMAPWLVPVGPTGHLVAASLKPVESNIDEPSLDATGEISTRWNAVTASRMVDGSQVRP